MNPIDLVSFCLPRACRSFALFATLFVSAGFVGSAGPAWAGLGDCAQPVSGGAVPVASDCLFILRVSVDLEQCRLCICDVDGGGTKNASDALACLQRTVSDQIELKCGPCISTTTTGVTTTSSTTSTSQSTSSTTTTTRVFCAGDNDCDSPGHRCNPFNSICEKPCTRNLDCRGFYACDITDNYCKDVDR